MHAGHLPSSLARYFWDCDWSAIRINTHRTFVIERILRYGTIEAVRWLLAHVPRASISDVVQHSRRLDPKTRNFWILMGYGV